MTKTKRMTIPMSRKEISQYQKLKASLIVQAKLILDVFSPLRNWERVTRVEFDDQDGCDEKLITIWCHGSAYGVDYDDFYTYPRSYLCMTADELNAEKARLSKEEERKKAEMVALAKASLEKRVAEKERKEKEKRRKKYLKLKAEFEGEKDSNVIDKPKKESVYACKHWEYEYDDFGKYSMCYNRNCKLQACDCKRIYAQQFCPFYEKGELRGKWVIGDEDKQAADEFKKQFEDKEKR